MMKISGDVRVWKLSGAHPEEMHATHTKAVTLLQLGVFGHGNPI